MANYLKWFLGVSFFIVSLNMKEKKICLSILYQFANKSNYQSKYQWCFCSLWLKLSHGVRKFSRVALDKIILYVMLFCFHDFLLCSGFHGIFQNFLFVAVSFCENIMVFLNSRTQCDALYDQVCVIFNVGLWFSKHAAAVAGKDEYVSSPFYYLVIMLISLIERCFSIVTFHSFFSKIIGFGVWNIMQWCCFFTLLLMFLGKGQRWRRLLKCTNAWE